MSTGLHADATSPKPSCMRGLTFIVLPFVSVPQIPDNLKASLIRLSGSECLILIWRQVSNPESIVVEGRSTVLLSTADILPRLCLLASIDVNLASRYGHFGSIHRDARGFKRWFRKVDIIREGKRSLYRPGCVNKLVSRSFDKSSLDTRTLRQNDFLGNFCRHGCACGVRTASLAEPCLPPGDVLLHKQN